MAEKDMNRRAPWVPLRRFLAATTRSGVPHKLSREEFVGCLLQLALAEVLVVAIWSFTRVLGIQPLGRPPIAALVWGLVMVAGMTIFGLRQNLKGERGIGWPGAFVSAVAATTASLFATVLSGGH
jgi:hypothetical protein